MSERLDQIKGAIERLNKEVGKSPFEEAVQDILLDLYHYLARLEEAR